MLSVSIGDLMKEKMIVICVLALLSIPPIFSSTLPLYRTLDYEDGAELPVWSVNDHWEYDMKISYSTPQASATIAMDANFRVVNISEENYTLNFHGDVTGSIEVAGIINGDFQNTIMNGEVYVRKSDLAMEKASIHMEGEIQRAFVTNSFYVDIELKQNVTPAVSPYDFPIEAGETWNVSKMTLWLRMKGEAQLAVPYQINYDFPVYITQHALSCSGIENVSSPAGLYTDGYHVLDNANHYQFWYSPSAHNVIKTDYENIRLWYNESLYWDINQWTALLKDTNYIPQNLPPYPPSNPYPEDNATNISTDVTLTWDCSDPDGDAITYDIYFGDSSPPPQVEKNISQNSYNPGKLQSNTTYYWRIVALDNHGHASYGEIWKFTTSSLQNHPPEKPSKPVGPTSGMVNQSYTYSSFTTDLDNDEIYYLFDWGDGNNSGWIGPYKSGEKCSASHIWKSMGNYIIRVKAKDVHGEESEWSDGLPISMPKVYGFTMPEWLKDMGEWIFHFVIQLFHEFLSFSPSFCFKI